MVVLKNINKTYKTKKTSPVDALKDINMTLPDQGLIFILGQSGSGKTTLMNIIGGLDTPTKGEMTFLDKEFTKNNQKELEDYRNKYIGFVFQDYNIIPELNVKENLMLGMTFQSTSKTNDKVEEVLGKVLLKDYEKRYPSELSGGQLQRIAIARSFMKESKILLVDEPTGNLDDETGDEIMKVLQEVAKEKLVIVVTHNEELAKKYGKRIIRLKDGEIDSDNGDTYQLLVTEKYDGSEKKHFSNTIALKMGFNNLGLRKMRLFVTVVLMVISFTALAFTFAVFSYHYADPHAKLIETRGYEYFNLSNVSYYDLEAIRADYPEVITIDNQKIKSKDDVKKYGFELYPESIELDKTSYYVSESLLYQAYDSKQIAIINDVEITLDYKKHPFKMLIGAKIESIGNSFKIAGIFKSDFKVRPSDLDEKADDYTYDFHATIFVSEDSIVSPQVSIGADPSNKKLQATAHYQNFHTSLEYLNLSIYGEQDSYKEMVGKGSLITDTKLNSDEVYISFGAYKEMFHDPFAASHYIYSGGAGIVIKKELEYVGEEIEVEIYDRIHDRFNIFKFKLKGVYFGQMYELDIYMNEESFIEPARFATLYSVDIKTSSSSSYKGFLKTCVNKYDVLINTPISEAQAEFENLLATAESVMPLICISLVLIVLLQTISFISQGITARQKEIGILKALGARNKDVRKIYIYENLFLCIPVVIFSIVFAIISIYLVNYIFSLPYSPDFKFLFYRLYIPFASVLAILVVSLLGTLIPLYKINRMQPVDAIRK